MVVKSLAEFLRKFVLAQQPNSQPQQQGPNSTSSTVEYIDRKIERLRKDIQIFRGELTNQFDEKLAKLKVKN